MTPSSILPGLVSMLSLAHGSAGTSVGPAPEQPPGNVTWDIDLVHCEVGECGGGRWNHITGVGAEDEGELPAQAAEDEGELPAQAAADGTMSTDRPKGHRKMDSAGVVRDRRFYGDGYSKQITFGGFGNDQLCTRYNRTAPIDGHAHCPLARDWYQMWPVGKPLGKETDCFADDMRGYQSGKTMANAPGTEIRLGKCGRDHTTDKWPGGYDFRYGGIRPQDNSDMSLYPAIAKDVEETVEKTGKKVIVRGCSGGTINGYAFLMSQTEAWRKKHVMAFVAVAPVFGGTVSSLHSVLAGWKKSQMDRCAGRAAAELLPSVLWMWPRKGLWNKTETLVITKTKNYTAYDLDRMLLDMGLPKTKAMLDLEAADDLGAFAPPMVDTYVFYGYGLATEAGFDLGHRDFAPATDGPDICPDGKDKNLRRPWDDGDVVAPLRSCARAAVWADPHKRAGVVLQNYGYDDMHHSCNVNGKHAGKDYDCVMAKLQGKPHGDC